MPTEKEIEIADMQCHVFHAAQKKWQLSGAECAAIFEKYKLLDFIRDCYDLLHVSSYDHAVSELEDILAAKGEKKNE